MLNSIGLRTVFLTNHFIRREIWAYIPSSIHHGVNQTHPVFLPISRPLASTIIIATCITVFKRLPTAATKISIQRLASMVLELSSPRQIQNKNCNSRITRQKITRLAEDGWAPDCRLALLKILYWCGKEMCYLPRRAVILTESGSSGSSRSGLLFLQRLIYHCISRWQSLKIKALSLRDLYRALIVLLPLLYLFLFFFI